MASPRAAQKHDVSLDVGLAVDLEAALSASRAELATSCSDYEPSAIMLLVSCNHSIENLFVPAPKAIFTSLEQDGSRIAVEIDSKRLDDRHIDDHSNAGRVTACGRYPPIP